jgi:DNA-binding XRE family transcriptional regulator
MNFGENLRLLRKNSKMSQEVLAEKLGVSRHSVSKWEVGSAYPEMTNITALCSIFHCNINDLINENIIDVDSFDEVTKEDIVKFKENQQKNMKLISKTIYIIAKICRIVVGIPTVCLILACIVFPIIAHTFSVEDNKIKILNQEILYSIENNVLTIDGSTHYINTSTNIKEFVENHDNIFFIISIEYVLLCVTLLSAISVQTLHYLYKLYKNVYEGDTPFTIDNERIIKK